jgi:HEAT repeat protein
MRATLQSPHRDDKRLFLALIKALQDSDEFQTSMIADLTLLLYQTDNIPILRLLINSLPEARQSVKISIINTLAKIDIPQIAAPLVRTMETESEPEILCAIARAFGKISNEKTLKLLGLLFMERPQLRHWHKYILCRQADHPLSLYRELLSENDPILKYAALILISRKMPPELENELLEILHNTDDVLLQVKIIECLGRSPAEKIFPVYLKLLGQNPVLDGRIISEIGFRKQIQHIEIVHKYFQSENPQLKMQAILAAGQIADQSSLPLLSKALDEQENANNTATIIRVLGNFQSDQVLLRVVQALSSPIGRIRANAIDSLMAMNAAQTVNQIERLLQDDNNRARANAALACLRFGRIQHFDVLAEMASSTNKWMRLSCLWALSVTGMPEAREIILGLIRDPDYDVLLSAIGFLKKIDRDSRQS